MKVSGIGQLAGLLQFYSPVSPPPSGSPCSAHSITITVAFCQETRPPVLPVCSKLALCCLPQQKLTCWSTALLPSWNVEEMLLLKLVLNFTASFPWTSFLGQAKASQLVSTLALYARPLPSPICNPIKVTIYSPLRGERVATSVWEP